MKSADEGRVHVEAETPSERSQCVGTARAAFRKILLPHPGQHEVVAALDELRLTALAASGYAMGGI